MKSRHSGFTLIEVLVAMFILTGGILVLANAWSGNFMRMRKTTLFNDVSTLLERKMVETEAKYKGKALTEIPEEDGGEFEGYPQYTWKFKSRDLKLPDLTPLLVGQKNGEGADETLIAMLKQVSESISKAVKEVKVSVIVKRNSKVLEFAAVEYFVDFNADFASGLPGGGGPTPAPSPTPKPNATPNPTGH